MNQISEINMAEEKRKQQILKVLPEKIRDCVKRAGIPFETLQEIRIRIGAPLLCIANGDELVLPHKNKPHIITRQELDEALEYVSQYSFFAFEQEMKQGFITIEGGHRVGLGGKVVVEEGHVRTMTYISSMNVRIAHEVTGCAEKLLPFLTANKKILHTMIIAPPRCGKTTVLRDLIRLVSDGNALVKGCTVGVVDERSEIGGCYMGAPQNHLGIRTDILDCCPKAEGMIMLIRSMAPQVIAVDEIGAPEDVHAIEYAMHCGCKMLSSVHGDSFEEIRKKPCLMELTGRKRFERYVILGNEPHAGTVKDVLDENGESLLTAKQGGALCI